MSVPYMGSKRVSAPKIVNLIKAYEPNSKDFYDVFCGGFAISEWALQKGFNVYASDLNKQVIELERKVIFGKAIDPKTGISIFEKPRFITRDDFLKEKDDSTTPDWFRGYLITVWSFGNKGTNYLFGKDVEDIKHAGHKLVVDREITSEILKYIPRVFCEKIISYDTIYKRRMALVKYCRHKVSRKLDDSEQLQRLQRLQQLQQLQQLQKLDHKSYDEVEIKPNDIIYCDPPYANTASYVANNGDSFNHQKFYAWCREKSKTNPIFISEYNMPDDFKKIYEFSRRQTFSKGDTKHNEKVFYIDNRNK